MLNLKRRDLYIMEITAARKWERINDTIRSIHIIQDNDEIFFYNTKCICFYVIMEGFFIVTCHVVSYNVNRLKIEAYTIYTYITNLIGSTSVH